MALHRHVYASVVEDMILKVGASRWGGLGDLRVGAEVAFLVELQVRPRS